MMSTDGFSEPASLAELPASPKQRRLVLVVALLLFLTFLITTPFANTLLTQVPAFVPSIQAIMFVNDFITSILLFSQYALIPSTAILILASGYLFTALIVVVQALAFPDAFVPGHLIGGLQTAAWIYVFWHLAQPIAIIAYAYLKDGNTSEFEAVKRSVNLAISVAVAVAVGFVAVIAWVSISLEKYLPLLQQDAVYFTAPVLNNALLALGALLSMLALWLLWVRGKTLLDYWLMLVAWTLLLEEILFNLFTDARYSVGFYTGRMLLLATSIFVLAFLLAETIFLSGRLARLTMILRRERDNKLMNMEAMAASISHELKQPLTAITMNGAAVLQILERTPLDLDELRSAATDIVEEGHHSNQIIDNIRILFGKATHREETVDLNGIVRRAVSTLHGELMRHKVISRTALASKIPAIKGHRTQLEEVIVNLCANSIEAMSNVPANCRSLTIRTHDENGKAAVVEVEDTGPGVEPDTSARIFDAFFTTKSDGMGLGLALSRMIVERHNGRLTLASALPSGCVFRIELPAAMSIQTA
jgi:signal transduction histidine kinase